MISSMCSDIFVLNIHYATIQSLIIWKIDKELILLKYFVYRRKAAEKQAQEKEAQDYVKLKRINLKVSQEINFRLFTMMLSMIIINLNIASNFMVSLYIGIPGVLYSLIYRTVRERLFKCNLFFVLVSLVVIFQNVKRKNCVNFEHVFVMGSNIYLLYDI